MPVISETKDTKADIDCNIFKGSERLHRVLMSEFGYMKIDSGAGRGGGSLLCV